MPETSLVGNIMNMQIQKTKKQVRSLLGRFYRTFMPIYAEKVVCLTELTAGTSTTTHIKWSSRHEEALREV